MHVLILVAVSCSKGAHLNAYTVNTLVVVGLF